PAPVRLCPARGGDTSGRRIASSIRSVTEIVPPLRCRFFFFNDPPTTEIYTLSLHDALPICRRRAKAVLGRMSSERRRRRGARQLRTSCQAESDVPPLVGLPSASSRCTLEPPVLEMLPATSDP